MFPSMTTATKKMMTTQEIATLMRCHPVTVQRWIRAGEFKTATRLGRRWLVRASEVEAMLSE